MVYLKDGELKITNFSEVQLEKEVAFGVSGRQDIPIILGPPEPEVY